MDDRIHFASLLFAAHMGIHDRRELIVAAGQRLDQVKHPEDWLIELATRGDSTELNQLIGSGNERVCVEFLGLAYHGWIEDRINDAKFKECCALLCHDRSKWYQDLLWIDNEFDLTDDGVFDAETSRKEIRLRVERMLQCE